MQGVWPLQLRSEFLGVPEDSQVPFSGVWVATWQLPQSGVATIQVWKGQVQLGGTIKNHLKELFKEW